VGFIRTFTAQLSVYGPAALLTIIAFVVAYQFVDPAPPSKITIAAGNPSGAYTANAHALRRYLSRHGIDLEVLATEGTQENLKKLTSQSARVDLAYVQGGVYEGGDDHALVALGSMYYEPVWLFHRQGLNPLKLVELADKRWAIGSAGSGTRSLMLRLLDDNGIFSAGNNILAIDGENARKAFAAGDVDVIALVAGSQSETVRQLADDPKLALFDFHRASAYTRRHRFLSKIELPEGAIDLAADVPPSDVRLLATTASLVARDTLHPALIDLVMQAASEVHGDGGLFEQRGEFPSPNYSEFPLSKEAARFYEHGPPFLQRYLPFWAATSVDRLKVMLLPFLALLIPLVKVMPPVYRWHVRSRIYRWYDGLQSLDRELGDRTDATSVAQALASLERIEEEVKKVSIPPSYGGELYALKYHLDRTRQRLEKYAGS
jgi:TRAP-type uncharacterized transport system substrate-binding protein